MMTRTTAAVSTAQFAADVQYYLTLTPRQLPSRYFYDALGSALFDAICQLPWYRITRAETRLLACARAGRSSRRCRAVRRSSSSDPATARSSRRWSKAAAVRPSASTAPHRHLAERARSRGAALAALAAYRSSPTRRTYEAGLARRRAIRVTAARSCCSSGRTSATSIGPAPKRSCAASAPNLRRGDALLLGADLVKPERELLLAYDDPLGVTAAFNRNLLVRINRELGGNFDLEQFAHRAVWEPRPRASRCTW